MGKKGGYLMKKFLLFLLTLVMLATSFTGCGQATQTDKNSSTVAATTQTVEPTAPPEPVTIKWIWKEGGNVQVPEDSYICKKILKDLNIKYVHISPMGMDYNEKLQTLLAAQDVPDIMESWTTQTTLFRNYGVIIPVEKYLTPEYLGNLFKVENNWDLALKIVQRPDGHSWSIPCTFGTTVQEVPFIRYDWLKNLNLPVPKTFDELKNVLTQFTKNDPDKNGRNDTVGTMLVPQGWAAGYDINFAAASGTWYKDGSGNATMGMFLPRVKDYLKYLKSLIDSGAVDKEIANNDPNALSDKIKAGKVGFAFNWCDVKWIDEIKKVQPNAEWGPMPVPKGVYDQGYLPGGGLLREEYCISSKCADVDAAIKLMNYMAEDFSTPEKLDFTGAFWEVSYGQKGVNWDVTPDGKFDATGNFFPKIAEQNKIDNYVGRCRRWRTKFEVIARRSGMREDELKASESIDTYPFIMSVPADNSLAQIMAEGVEFSEDVSKFSETYLNTKWPEFYMKALLGKVDIDSGWEAFVKEAEGAGYKDIQAAATETLKKYGNLK
jgi:ABC-type glycerol-3-phosphate transport system substrate-binding protein